jgi:hypothetical protein
MILSLPLGEARHPIRGHTLLCIVSTLYERYTDLLLWSKCPPLWSRLTVGKCPSPLVRQTFTLVKVSISFGDAGLNVALYISHREIYRM